jgi:hypothetical protein
MIAPKNKNNIGGKQMKQRKIKLENISNGGGQTLK